MVQFFEFCTCLLPVNLKLSSYPFWGTISYASDFGGWYKRSGETSLVGARYAVPFIGLGDQVGLFVCVRALCELRPPMNAPTLYHAHRLFQAVS
jgi:hypothetical protein